MARTIVDLVCERCSKSFSVPKYREISARYCSESCRKISPKVPPRPPWDRFWSKVVVDGSCWVFTGTPSQKYPFFDDGSAHRKLWEMMTGQTLPSNVLVCHRCDRPRCVRFDHLFVGSHADNIADMDRKGRRRTTPLIGERNPRAKLKEVQIPEIRELIKLGHDDASIAKSYGVSSSAIWMIRRGQNWNHVP